MYTLCIYFFYKRGSVREICIRAFLQCDNANVMQAFSGELIKKMFFDFTIEFATNSFFWMSILISIHQYPQVPIWNYQKKWNEKRLSWIFTMRTINILHVRKFCLIETSWNPQRISSYPPYDSILNFEGRHFPIDLKDIPKF